MADSGTDMWRLPDQPRHIRKFNRHNALSSNWDYSLAFLNHVRSALEGRLSDNTRTIGLAGSFGRLEGSKNSDADYILVVHDLDSGSIDGDREVLEEAILSYGVSTPNKSGVFSAPCTVDTLLDSTGELHERSDELGKRMLLLLESRSIYNDAEFQALLETILELYIEDIAHDSDKEFAFLLNDLIRYFRFICVNYQANFWRENDKWTIRNLKLRHSRIIMYAGLLFLIGEASRHQNEKKLATLRDNLRLTPLERIAFVYETNLDHGFFRVMGLYNVFAARLNDSGWRARINAVPYDQRYTVSEFAEVKANSDALVAELMRFMMSRRGVWSDRFFEYLIF